MEFAALPKTLEGFLDSIVPALGHLVLLALLILFIVGGSRVVEALRNRFHQLQTLDDLAQDAFVKESGLLKLVPVTLLVAALLGAIALHRTVLSLGNGIPGQLGYSEPYVLVEAVPRDTLAQLWCLFPAAADEHMLYLVLEQQVSMLGIPANAESTLPWTHHDELFSNGARAISSAKFYLTVAFAFVVFRRRLKLPVKRTLLCFAAVLIVAATVATSSVFQQMEARKQSDWAKVNFVIAKQIAGGKDAELRLQDDTARRRFADRLTEYKRSRDDQRPFYLQR